MRETGEPSTWVHELCSCHIQCCARPTGGDHGCTTDDPAQRASGKGYVKILLRRARGRGTRLGYPGPVEARYPLSELRIIPRVRTSPKRSSTKFERSLQRWSHKLGV